VRARNWRRLSEVTAVEDNDPARVSGGVSFMVVRMEGECCAMEVFAKEAAG
jgi:predicted transcriptional regulator with HTH domain